MSLCPRRDTPARAYTECNADGIRTKKTVNGVTTRYTLNGTQVLAQQTGTDAPIYFTYDANGHPYSMTYSNTKSFYLCNQYGDVLALLNESGDKIAEYTYSLYDDSGITSPLLCALIYGLTMHSGFLSMSVFACRIPSRNFLDRSISVLIAYTLSEPGSWMLLLSFP